MILQIVGGIWAALGGANLIGMFASAAVSPNFAVFGLIFNVVLFVLPGLAVFGIGSRMKVSRGSPCPFCAEKIKAEAIVCPHCRRDLPSGQIA